VAGVTIHANGLGSGAIPTIIAITVTAASNDPAEVVALVLISQYLLKTGLE
jgi:hypothetical protein